MRIGDENTGPADTLLWDVATAYHRNDETAKLRTITALEQAIKVDKQPRWWIWGRLRSVLLDAGDVDGADELIDRPRDPKMPPAILRAYTRLDGFQNTLRGHYRAAAKFFAAAREPGSKEANPDLAVEPFFTPTPAELHELRAQVERYDSIAGPSPEPGSVLRPQFRLYWLAMLNCRLGNTAEALSQAQKIESLPAPVYWQPALQALATNVRAFADVAQGNYQQALSRIESIPIDVPLDLRGTPAARIEETLWHGELLYRVRRYDEALAWFENPSDQNQEAWPFFKLRAAQIYDRKGDWKKAASLYADFLKYWKDPDPELRPLVEEARRALAVLQRRNG